MILKRMNCIYFLSKNAFRWGEKIVLMGVRGRPCNLLRCLPCKKQKQKISLLYCCSVSDNQLPVNIRGKRSQFDVFWIGDQTSLTFTPISVWDLQIPRSQKYMLNEYTKMIPFEQCQSEAKLSLPQELNLKKV